MYAKCPTLVGLQDTKKVKLCFITKVQVMLQLSFLQNIPPSLSSNQNLQQEKFPFVKHNLVFIIIQTKEININGGYFTKKDIYYILTTTKITLFFNFTAQVPE